MYSALYIVLPSVNFSCDTIKGCIVIISWSLDLECFKNQLWTLMKTNNIKDIYIEEKLISSHPQFIKFITQTILYFNTRYMKQTYLTYVNFAYHIQENDINDTQEENNSIEEEKENSDDKLPILIDMDVH